MFESKKIAKMLGISLRQIQYWDEQGIVQPSIKKAYGRGTRRLYSFEDLVQLKVVKRLRDNNISLNKIKKSVAYLKKELPNVVKPLAEFTFITDGETIFNLTDDSDKLIDTLRSGQLTWNIPIKNIVQEVVTIKEADSNYHLAKVCMKH